MYFKQVKVLSVAGLLGTTSYLACPHQYKWGKQKTPVSITIKIRQHYKTTASKLSIQLGKLFKIVSTL